jgi:5-methylcytosine-specific restriction endonuclease McrA
LNYEDEDYVRFYTRDTVSWMALGWEGQAVLSLMLHGKFDRSGVFECDSHDYEDAVSLVTGLPVAVARAGLAALTRADVWICAPGAIVWPTYVRAQYCRHCSDRGTKWSRDNYEAVRARDGSTCRYCGLANRKTHIDHVIPRCAGGGDEAENLVVACVSCNCRKGGRTPEQAGMVLQ